MKLRKASKRAAPLAAFVSLMALCLPGCDRKQPDTVDGVVQTKYPGEVSAGGLTSGEIMARSDRPETDGTYAGGTPGIAGGSGGNTSGAETGGTVQESGQGPSSGVTTPSSAGRPGTRLDPGDYGGSAPPSAPPRPAPASNATPQEPAEGQTEKTQ